MTLSLICSALFQHIVSDAFKPHLAISLHSRVHSPVPALVIRIYLASHPTYSVDLIHVFSRLFSQSLIHQFSHCCRPTSQTNIKSVCWSQLLLSTSRQCCDRIKHMFHNYLVWFQVVTQTCLTAFDSSLFVFHSRKLHLTPTKNMTCQHIQHNQIHLIKQMSAL